MTEKFCKDCKHSYEVINFWCNHPVLGLDKVTGAQKTEMCISMRHRAGKCGEDGKLFEGEIPKYKAPRKSILDKLFARLFVRG